MFPGECFSTRDPARGKGRLGNRGRSSGEYIHSPPRSLRRRRSDYPIPRSPLFPPPSAFVTGIHIEKVSPRPLSSSQRLVPSILSSGGRTEKSFMCVVFFFLASHIEIFRAAPAKRLQIFFLHFSGAMDHGPLRRMPKCKKNVSLLVFSRKNAKKPFTVQKRESSLLVPDGRKREEE